MPSFESGSDNKIPFSNDLAIVLKQVSFYASVSKTSLILDDLLCLIDCQPIVHRLFQATVSG